MKNIRLEKGKGLSVVLTMAFMGASVALTMPTANVKAQENKPYETYKDCTQIDNAAIRLKCYDAFANGGVYTPEAAQKDLIDTIGKPTEIEQAKQDTPDEVSVEIVRMWHNPYGMSRFRTSDGQVWRQTSGNSMRLRDAPFKAVIKKGFGSSYYLSPEGTSRSVNVRRSQ